MIILILGLTASSYASNSTIKCHYRTYSGICIIKQNVDVVEMINNVAKVIDNNNVLLLKKITINKETVINAYMRSDYMIDRKYCDISNNINYIVAADTLRQVKCP
jgi:uncharacterized protein (DUF2344 family)